MKAIENFLAGMLNELFSQLFEYFSSKRFSYLPSLRSGTSRIFSKSIYLNSFEKVIEKYFKFDLQFNKIEKSFLKTLYGLLTLSDEYIGNKENRLFELI